MIRHIVLFRVASSRSVEDVAAVLAALEALATVVAGLSGFTAGPNVSPEGLGRGYTHGFTMDFADAAARDAYLVHPAHQAAAADLVGLVEGGVDGLMVFDVTSPGP